MVVDNALFSFVSLSFVSAILGIQMAKESTLALSIKQLLYLQQPYNKKLELLGKVKTWWQLTGKFSIILLPFYFIIVILLRCHHFLSELLECSRCTSVWINFILLYFLLKLPITEALVFAPLSILAVYITEMIQAKANNV